MLYTPEYMHENSPTCSGRGPIKIVAYASKHLQIKFLHFRCKIPLLRYPCFR
jgi:hypothetical protein